MRFLLHAKEATEKNTHELSIPQEGEAFMLQLENISKQYQTGELVQQALDKISLNLRETEFVSILGPSGSGKTTLLNIIGGLDRYDSGDLIINGISTEAYKDRDWDSYRNHTIGFVFQSYNLIPHQSILANVELALTISGISRRDRRSRAKKVLEDVGLGDQLHKKPNQLSGGQMQRVAIARALVNDPGILLADEPTGSLDSDTSVQVMDLLKEVSKDRLVVMVTHNQELAELYSTRIVRLRDGRITDDSNPFNPETNEQTGSKPREKARMSFTAALSLSFNNLRSKKGRTLMTAVAASIGIIGIALVLSLSSGVNSYIDTLQRDTMSAYPIVLAERTAETSSLLGGNASGTVSDDSTRLLEQDADDVYMDYSSIESILSFSSTENNLKAFKRYLEEDNNEVAAIAENIVYGYDIDFAVYSYDRDGILVRSDADITELSSLDLSENATQGASGPAANMERINSMLGSGNETANFSELLPGPDGELIHDQIKENYELAYGNWPDEYDEVVLVLDENQSIDTETLYQLGLLSEAEFTDLVDAIMDDGEIKTLLGTYEELCQNTFILTPGDGEFSEADGIELSISGIILPVEGAENTNITTTVVYTSALTEHLIELTDTNIEKPSSISIYTSSFEDKEALIEAIEDYNFHVSMRNRIVYTDYAELLTSTVTSMVDIISYVLIAFVAISLIVSSIMIAIITHISVMERTKEIGILRALGASKSNISQVFNAETILIGLCSGMLGVGIAVALSVPLTAVVQNALGFAGISIALPVAYAALLILLSMCITVIAGLIPSMRAAKQDPVIALRSE